MKDATPVSGSPVYLLLVFLACSLVPSHAPAAGDKNPRVIPPQAMPHSMSYGEWSAERWQWIVGIPAAQNPGLDETGELGAVDQEGPVWFLAGLFGSGEVTRAVTVPAGKALFFPLYNWSWWAPDDLDDAASWPSTWASARRRSPP